MMDIVKGSVVKSKAGHDKDCFSVVVELNGNEVYICDGKYHKLENPKKKNIKHICATRNVIELPQTNKQIRKILNGFSTIDQEVSYVKTGRT